MFTANLSFKTDYVQDLHSYYLVKESSLSIELNIFNLCCRIYSSELKARVPADSSQPQSKRPIRGAGAMRDDQSQERGIVTYDKLPTETVVRKMDAYLQETYHLLRTITLNTDRLLGRNTQSPSLDSGFS